MRLNIPKPVLRAGFMRAGGLMLAVVWVVTGIVVLSSAPARAAVTHEYLSQITEVPELGPHGESVALPGPLEFGSMTFDSGHLWVVEPSRVDEFDATTGAFVAQPMHAESPTVFGGEAGGIAVGHATGEGEVYVGERVGGEPAVAVFNEAGGLQATWTGTPSGPFGAVSDVAVDDSTSVSDPAAGDAYVVDDSQNAVDVFRPEAAGKETYVRQLTGPSPGEAFQLVFKAAVNQANGDLAVFDIGAETVYVFEPTVLGEYALVHTITGTPNGPFKELFNVAVDSANGEIFVREGFGDSVIDQFSSSGAYLGKITGAAAPGGELPDSTSVAVDPDNHEVYIENRESLDFFGPDIVIPDVTVTEPVSNLKAMSTTLGGTVNPDEAGEATCEFELGTSTAYGQRVPCSEHVANGGAPVPVKADVAGLAPDTTYHYRLDATNVPSGGSPGGTNVGECPADCGAFTTAGPGLHSESVKDVSATTAELQATIDPHKAPTSYYFQYGTTDSYGTDLPAPPGAVLGSGDGDLAVSQPARGLQASTTYHYRVVELGELEGKLEEFDGPDQTFTTQGTGGFGLPDGRAWELVSPPDKHGARIQPIQEVGVIQASAAGDALTYLTTAPTEDEPAGNSNQTQVLSRRATEGWESRDIAIPHEGSVGAAVGIGQEYRFFSSDLSLAIVQPFGTFDRLVSPEASELTPYLRTNYPAREVDAPCLNSCYRPVVTGSPGHENVPSGTVFGQACPFSGNRRICGPQFEGASPDLSHVVLSSEVALIAGAPAAEVEPGQGSSGKGSLYEWSGGRLALVSALPDGQPASASSTPALGDQDAVARNAVSVDGSRVVWSERGGEQHLYMRVNSTRPQSPLGASGECLVSADACTVQLDAAAAGVSPSGAGTARFQTASSEGSKVLFTDDQELTNGAGSEGNLYECDIVSDPVTGGPKCELEDLTPKGPSGESAAVRGTIPGASEDASYVYFVANGVLASNENLHKETAQPGNCAGEVEGSATGEPCNLYVRHAGTSAFVAVLSDEDRPDWATGGNILGHLTARVSPDGRWLAFMSDRSLTGYDNRDSVSGRPDEEVYLYDAAANDGAGKLVCASCDPSGARPQGLEYRRLESGNGGLAFGRVSFADEQGIAANVPGWTPALGTGQTAFHQSRYLSNEGRLFFNSSDALVPQDSNGTGDVYEYEPAGVGSCATSGVTFAPAAVGCVALISPGTSKEESAFLDASESGDDVFFLSAAQLSATDIDGALDVYDARVGGGFAEALPVPACEGDACQSPASPPEDATPGSLTYRGPGNLTPLAAVPVKPKPKPLTRAQKLAKALKTCRRVRSKAKRARCVRTARKKYGAATAKRSANTNREPR